VGFKILLNHGIGEILRDPIFSNGITKALSEIKHFRYFDDEQIIGMFKEIALTDADSACSDLLNRRKLVHFASYRNLSRSSNDDKVKKAAKECAPRAVLSKETVVRADPTEKDLEMIRVLAKNHQGRRELIDMPPDSINLYRNYFNERKLHIYTTAASWVAKQTQVVHGGEPKKGYLISALGIPCCGKSTVMRHLAANLGAQYFREPEEIKWPTAVLKREEFGYLTAITWFRSMRVPHLFQADLARREGKVAVVDSYYDKVMHYYLGKEAMRWLIPNSDPYFLLCQELARIDEDRLPNVDLLVLFRVEESDWMKFIDTRSRDLDNNEEFRNSFAMQEYFFEAARELAKKRNIKIHEFNRRFETGPTPIQDAASQLYREIRAHLPDHLKF
jgi:thymidylate kinase